MRLWSILFTLFFSASAYTQGNTYTVNYSTANGMLSNVTYSGLFDRNNHLWICTDRGLSRFDGTNFTHFTIAEGLPDNDVIYVTESTDGTIWAQPFQRETAFLSPNSSVFTNINTIIPPDTVSKDLYHRVFKLKDGAVALLAKNGTIRIVQHGKWIKSHDLSINTESWYTFIYENAKRQLVIIRPGETKIIDPNGTTSVKKNKYAFHRYEIFGDKAVFQQKGENLLIVYDFLKESVSRINTGIPINKFGFLEEKIMIGDLSRKIFYFNSHTGKVQTDSLSTLVSFGTQNSAGSVQVIFSADEGIFVRTFNQQNKYTHLNKIPYHFSLEDNQLSITGPQGEVIFPSRKNLRVPIKESPAIPLFTESFGNIDIIYGAILMYYKSGKHFQPAKAVGSVKDIHFLNDSIRYLATHSGIFSFNKKNYTYKSLYTGRTTCVSTGPDGSLFIGTHWGLLERKKDGSIRDWTKSKGFPNVRIVDIVCRDQVIWVATAGKGLFAIYKEQVRPFLNQQNGISRNLITSIEEDANQNLYIGYYDGAEKVRYKLVNRFPEIAERVILETYHNEGIKSFFRFKDHLYALGNKGIFIFDENKPEMVREFNLRITRIMINNKLCEVSKKYSLSTGDYDFLISLSSVNFEHFPLQYRYRINDGVWNYTSENEIRYKNLSWGTYQITIQVLSNYYKPTDTKTILFEVHPPFYMKPVFLFAISILLGILIILFARNWFLKKYRKEKEWLLHENKLHELELVALKAQINPHFVFNCLNSIKGLIYGNELEKADKYIDRFAQLFRNTLEASSNTFHSVSVEIAYLRTYLEIEQVSLKDRFEFSIESDPKTLEMQIPTMLLQPHVENAVKHGMSGINNQKGRISVSFYLEKNQLIALVSDNGPGIKKAAGPKHAHSGKGIQITSRRAQLYRIKTEISDNIPSGTIVKLIIPPGINNTPNDNKSTTH
ncbi:Sensor histidine kinase YehU [compost metagenome]